ncbi:hypothetical protein J6TS7_49230 [Paenibacillus dendritiformis]|nr:hypothetical protein J6TS7_49230 [Paenibacillus dendritiformis]
MDTVIEERDVFMKKVIVIGAGILGASTAYQLAKMGADVLIVDRKDKGQATDAAAGISAPGCHSGAIRLGTGWPKPARVFTPG